LNKANITEKLDLILRNQNEIKDRVSKVEDALNEISLRIAANKTRLSTVEDVLCSGSATGFSLRTTDKI